MTLTPLGGLPMTPVTAGPGSDATSTGDGVFAATIEALLATLAPGSATPGGKGTTKAAGCGTAAAAPGLATLAATDGEASSRPTRRRRPRRSCRPAWCLRAPCRR
ncbi:MAG: hypothetical protein U0R80_15715 [Nocardioidaceae bacterium]